MNVYQTQSGIKIGLLYQRPAPVLDRDGLKLQTALLDPRCSKQPTGIQRVLGGVWKWL